ncbi:MAG: enoyl-CoA hydratase/isomerase family protein [Deltaproteobacteria bacterium]|nr:enoyl-CoA hydratase/isomerase family protein [Deltaproteobacteria bacterium]
MTFENIVYEKSGNVVTIIFNRPKTFNAYQEGLAEDLNKAMTYCYDEDVKAVILTGAGKAFCSGGDLLVFKEYIESEPSEPIRKLIKPFNRFIMSIRQMPKPVIAAVNGIAGGAGMSIVAACDYRIATAAATFKPAYSSVGLTGDGAWELLVPLLIGFGKATEIMLFDCLFDARQALEWGFVNRIVDNEKLKEVSLDVAERLAKGPTRAFGIIKENFNHAMLGLLSSQLQLEGEGMLRAAKTADYQEGIKAFLEKRIPVFGGT